MKTLKVIILVLLLSTGLKAQQWYPMGILDTLDGGNGPKGVCTFIKYNNKITIGGAFKYTGTTILNSVAQWNGNQWQPMSSGIWDANSIQGEGGVFGFKEYHNKLYCVGGFEGAGGIMFHQNHYAYNIAKWDNTDWYPMTQPADGFNQGSDALGVYHDKLYAGHWGGNAFDSSGMIIAHGIARWNDTVFSAIGQLYGDFPIYGDFAAMAFTNFDNKLIVGGCFTTVSPAPYGTFSGIATWNDTAWGALGNGFNNDVYALTVFNGELYAGGCFNFSRDSTASLNYIAKWNGTSWEQVGEGLNDTVYTLAVDSVHNKFYAGGGFTQTGLGVPAKHIAEWTGTNWQEVGGGTNRIVRALYASDSNLYVGGLFTRAGNVQASLIACWCVNNPVGIEEITNSNEEVLISPNPTTNQFTIENSQLRINSIHIYNVLGELVQSLKLESLKLEVVIDVSTWKAGVYFVEVETEKGVVRRKVIKSTMY